MINQAKNLLKSPLALRIANKGKTLSLLTYAVLLTEISGMALEVSDFGTSDHVIWERVTDTTGYTWSNSGALSDIKYNDNGSTTLYSASGILNAGNGNYYKFTYTNPFSTQASTGRINSLNRNVENEYFYNRSCTDRGGAIANNSTSNYSINADFIRNKATSSSGYGGGICNTNNNKLDNIVGNFIGNSARCGGAIANEISHINNINGMFIGNSADAGGAIDVWNYANLGPKLNVDLIIADCIGNKATNGGAIQMEDDVVISSLTGNFLFNEAMSLGGAVQTDRNGGQITFVADTKDILFYGNKDSTGYNDIYLDKGVMNFNATNDKNITLNGTITGNSSTVANNILNINDSTKNAAVGGTYNFNNSISNTTVNVASGANINFGTVVQPDSTRSYGSMSNATMTVNGSDVSLGTLNNRIDTSPTVANLTIKSPIKLAIDASLSNATADTVISSNITNQSGTNFGYLIIDAINLISDTTASRVDILLTSNSDLKVAYTLSNNIRNNITASNGVEYTINSIRYDSETGFLTLNGDTTHQSDVTVTIPDYLNIEQAAFVPTATATIVDVEHLALSTPPSVTYNVYSNHNSKLYVTATAPTGESTTNALYGNQIDDMTIVFTNVNGSASSANVGNCIGNIPNYNNNANAIAFKLNCNNSTASDTASPNIRVTNGVIEYGIDSGTTTLSFTVGNQALGGTFYANDPTGTYKATLTISSIAP